MTSNLRVAVLCDFAEEGWPSMDLVATMLLEQMGTRYAGVTAARVRPPFRRRFGTPGRSAQTLFNADRILNRLADYPRFLRSVRHRFDRFHVTDHTYASLVHHVPEGRAGVYCHDLDLFRCLLSPERERRPFWFRAMARHVLRGLAKAAVVFYSTAVIRAEIERHGLVDPARLVHAPLGVCPEFRAEAVDPEPAAPVLAPLRGAPFVLHVGSSAPRKRLDVLLDVFARVGMRHRDLRLVQIGGTWTDPHRRRIERLGIGARVLQVRGIDRLVLASLYRRAGAVLLPTESEGFGLPLVEALACGAPVVASDLPVLREVGGDAAVFRPVGDVDAWAAAVHDVLASASSGPPRSARLARAAHFSWSRHADAIVTAYGAA